MIDNILKKVRNKDTRKASKGGFDLDEDDKDFLKC